uniref:Uncharacterized protein n=1 Tax=Plectus sambesii TaxID=2011161 RepID=A0A914X319_9BILA
MILRIGAFREKPYAYGCFMKLPNKECLRPGYEIEFLDMIMRIARLDYEMVANGELGELESNASLSSGLFGTVQSGQVDLMSYFVRFTSARREQMVFTFPLTTYSQFYVVRTPSLQLKYSNYVLMPFQFEVWMTLLIALLAVITTQWLVKCRLNDLLLSVKSFVVVAWHTAIGILRLRAPGPRRPTSLAAAVVGVAWLLMWSIILIRSYRTTLIGTLVVKRQVAPLPFRSLDQLISKLADKTLVLTGGGSLELDCVDELCDRLNETLQANPVHALTDGEAEDEEAQRLLTAQDNYVTSMMMENNVRQLDSFLFTDFPKPYPIGIIDSDYPSQPGGIVLRRNFPRHILDKLNLALVKAMPGYENMIRRYRRTYPPVAMTLSLRGSLEGFKLDQFIFLLAFWGVGIVAASITFIVELLYAPGAQRRKKRCRIQNASTI